MKNQKGITLIALVITIIVLLILAGVTISLTVGKNGALSRARTAVTANDLASAAEEIGIAASDAQMQFYEAWNTNQSAQSINFYARTGAGNAYAANCTKAKSVALAKVEENNEQHVYIKYTTNSDMVIYFDMVVNSDDTSYVSEGYCDKDPAIKDNAEKKAILEKLSATTINYIDAKPVTTGTDTTK